MKNRLCVLSVKVGVILFTFHFSFLISAAQTPQEWRDSVSTLMTQIKKQPKDTDLRLRKAEANINLQQWDYAVPKPVVEA